MIPTSGKVPQPVGDSSYGKQKRTKTRDQEAEEKEAVVLCASSPQPPAVGTDRIFRNPMEARASPPVLKSLFGHDPCLPEQQNACRLCRSLQIFIQGRDREIPALG